MWNISVCQELCYVVDCLLGMVVQVAEPFAVTAATSGKPVVSADPTTTADASAASVGPANITVRHAINSHMCDAILLTLFISGAPGGNFELFGHSQLY